MSEKETKEEAAEVVEVAVEENENEATDKVAEDSNNEEAKKASDTTEKESESKPRERSKKAEKVEVDAVESAEPVAEENAEPKAKEKPKRSFAPPKPITEDDLKPLADFDWGAIGKNEELYSEKERAELESMYNETLSSVAEHEVIMGTVVGKTHKEVVINIGYKSEGIIALSEFRYNPELKISDEVEVFVESQEDKSGQLILSHKKARALKSWDRVNDSLANNEIIKGYVKCRTKGGMIVDVFGIEAFLPGSQIDVKPIRDYDVYVGKTMEFKVVKINHEFKNVVVSHKALIEAELEQQKKDIISKLEKGQVLEGTVKNITSYGVFIDLGGVDGLIHITDLSWGRINHPEELVELDQKLNVVILDFDDDKKRIALGLKQLSSHPWDALDEKLKVGDKVKGKVVVLADYGAFIEIQPGVEGLIHVSEMSWSSHLRSAQDFLSVNDEVEAIILTLDREERKMSLGIKQLIPDPWADIAKKYPVGSKHKGTVRNFTNFGVFIELEEGVDGLIHISDLSWSKKIKHPSEFTNIGDEIEVVALEVDEENRRLSLGHKQLEENPWDVFETVFTVDSVHQGTITEVTDKGGIVSLPYGVEGFVPGKHLIKEDGSKAKADETLDFKVLEFAKESKKILVSHTKTYSAGEDVADKKKKTSKSKSGSSKKAVKRLNDQMEKTTLGDFDVLSNLKSEMEESETGTTKTSSKKKKEPEAKAEVEAPVDTPVEEVDEKEEKPKKKTTAKKKEKEEEVKAEAEEQEAEKGEDPDAAKDDENEDAK